MYKVKVDAKNRLGTHCFTARNVHTEEKFKVKLRLETRKSVRRMLWTRWTRIR